jgi:hypothetical protein
MCTYTSSISAHFEKSHRNKFITVLLISSILFQKINKRTEFNMGSQELASCKIKINSQSYYGAQGWTDLTKLISKQKTEIFRLCRISAVLFLCAPNL